MIREEIFCLVHDFCRVFVPKWLRLQLEDGKKHRTRKASLAISEMATILILFHSSNYRTFKHFYLNQIRSGSLKRAFPKAPAYTTFVSWIPRVFPVLCAFLQSLKKKDSKGVHCVDSTAIVVCGKKRTGSHRVFLPHKVVHFVHNLCGGPCVSRTGRDRKNKHGMVLWI